MTPSADVGLILEGTYPYIAGGVSSWVHQLIQRMPDLTFWLIHIGSAPEARLDMKYQLPENVLGLTHLYVHDFRPVGRTRRIEPQRDERPWRALEDFHRRFRQGDVGGFQAAYSLIGDPSRGRRCPVRDLAHAPNSWELLVRSYEERGRNASFVDFYWAWRFTHWPLFGLLAADVPPCGLYHTVSTGYAGFLGALARLRYDAPLLCTEHGIYLRERKFDIAQAEWIYVEEQRAYNVRRTRSFFKDWWIDLFRFMSLITYEQSELIITLYEGNQRIQLADGAPPEKLRIVPNGVNIERFGSLIALRDDRDGGPFRVGFVGRVVPIKDVKTFIRAVKIASESIPQLDVYIIGPTDEDPDYFAECERLVGMLGLTAIIRFTGKADVGQYYPKLDVLVLTSVSEAQPLVILEGHCAGVPAIASDVGSCWELLHGRTAEDRALGPSGIVTGVLQPRETAEAIIALWRDPELRRAMSRAGIERARRYYREDDVFHWYHDAYRRYLRDE